MYRIDDPTAASALPTPESANAEGYWAEGNPTTGVAATIERASWFNMIQEELRAIVIAGGLTPSKTTYNQVLTSIMKLIQAGATGESYAVDSSTTANTISLALTPAITSYADGELIYFKAANTNTGACTINWGGGSIALNGAAGALQGGEIYLNKIYLAVYNATTGTAILLGQSGGKLQIHPATQSEHAIQLGQIISQAATAFTTSGTAPSFTLTPSPAITAYAANQRFRVLFNAAGTTGSNTLNISGLGAKSLMQYAPDGSLIPAIITANLLTDVEYNGTYMIVLNPVSGTDLATVATSGSYADLSNKPSIPAAQIQSDWNQATTSALDYIKNKPTIPPLLFSTVTDVTSSRAAGNVYTNSNGKPMEVCISLSFGSGSFMHFNINGVNICPLGGGIAGDSVVLTKIIPSGATYELVNTGTNQIINSWVETV